MVIVIGGMIGLGKSSVTKILGKHFNSKVFYESVDDNPILPLFYTESEEEIERKRYPFLLQLHFLNSKYKSMKKALIEKNSVLDRSIYEDWYFAKKNMELGRISELEMGIYEEFLENMMEDIRLISNKEEEIMVYLKGSFETVLERIKLRGRDFEVDDSLIDYYKFLWKDYDALIKSCYDPSKIVVIDMDVMDVVNSEEDRKKLIKMVEEKMK